MKYPNSNETYHKKISYANRGMKLEELINDANSYYIDNNIALIFKKPTPIGIVSVANKDKQKIITKAYFKEASTLDYNGVYKGQYIEFDAKETLSQTSFPLSNISVHQLKHIENIIQHKGIVFLVIKINNHFYLIGGKQIIDFVKSKKRKSIPIKYFQEHCININLKHNILDYIESLNLYLGGNYE